MLKLNFILEKESTSEYCEPKNENHKGDVFLEADLLKIQKVQEKGSWPISRCIQRVNRIASLMENKEATNIGIKKRIVKEKGKNELNGLFSQQTAFSNFNPIK